jgi:hypothetical protein
MNNCHIGKQTDTTVEIVWTHGECPSQLQVVDMLNSAKLSQLKPELIFDPKVTGYPFGKTLMSQKYLPGCRELDESIWKLGVTAVYEWFLFDRYRTNYCCSLTPHYECYYLYTTYDVVAKYHNQTPEFIRKFPDIAKTEELEWEKQRDAIESWLAEAWAENEQVSYFVAANIDRYVLPQREDFWPTHVPYTNVADEEREKIYNEVLEEELEDERCNPSKG